MADWQPTHAHLFADAVWEATDDELTTTEALVLVAYANHCRKSRKDQSWLAYSRLMQQCKIRSRTTVSSVLSELVKKGWLERVAPARAHKQSAVYRLTIPGETGPVSEPDRSSERTSPITGPVADLVPGEVDAVGSGPVIGETGPVIGETGPVSAPVRSSEWPPPAGWNSSGTLPAKDDPDSPGGSPVVLPPEDQQQAWNDGRGQELLSPEQVAALLSPPAATPATPATPAEIAALLAPVPIGGPGQ